MSLDCIIMQYLFSTMQSYYGIKYIHILMELRQLCQFKFVNIILTKSGAGGGGETQKSDT